MTLIDTSPPENRTKALIPLMVILLLLLTIVYLVSSSSKVVQCTVPSELKVTYPDPMPDERLGGSFWACNGLVCDRFMSAQEWAQKFCYSQDGETLCVIRTAQGPVAYPIQMLNLTAIKECAQYHCMQEVLVRNASYSLPAP
jgi:hypothetical protein